MGETAVLVGLEAVGALSIITTVEGVEEEEDSVGVRVAMGEAVEIGDDVVEAEDVAVVELGARIGNHLHRTARSWIKSWRLIWRVHVDFWTRKWIHTWQTNS